MTKTGKKLWERLKDRGVNGFCSDYWKSYCEFVPDHKHMQPKGGTFTSEGYNSRIRHYLARFRRKAKCYSKAEHMMEKSLKLLMLKLNNELPILVEPRYGRGKRVPAFLCSFLALFSGLG